MGGESPNPQAIRTAGFAGGFGAAAVLVGATFQNETLAFTVLAVAVPFLGWGLTGLMAIHRSGRTPIMSAGFWVAQAGVALLAAGYVAAALGAAREDTPLTDVAARVAITPSFLILLPIGLGLFGFAAWRAGTLGPWKRLSPSLTAAAGVLAPQFLVLGFLVLGYVTWSYGSKLAATPGN